MASEAIFLNGLVYPMVYTYNNIPYVRQDATNACRTTEDYIGKYIFRSAFEKTHPQKRTMNEVFNIRLIEGKPWEILLVDFFLFMIQNQHHVIL
jgi:hypothetical protein